MSSSIVSKLVKLLVGYFNTTIFQMVRMMAQCKGNAISLGKFSLLTCSGFSTILKFVYILLSSDNSPLLKL